MPNPRKNDNVHKLAGTYKSSRHGDPDTKPEWSDDLPGMPDWLDEIAQAEWKRTIEDAPAGVLTKTDRILLAMYCSTVSEYIRSHDPENKVNFLAADRTQLRLMQQELGFTPLSRGKIGGVPKSDSGEGSFGRT